jgi:pilin isopeptide linkage protein
MVSMRCQNIIFPGLTFTSPGVYTYTVKELTPPDAHWQTDGRTYRAVVTVTDNGDGTLEAVVEYPDGFPTFINVHTCPPPPCDMCKYFDCLPFPMHWFLPPQKPEYQRLMETSPHVFERWEQLYRDSRQS